MIQKTANSSASPPTTPPMMAPTRIPVLFLELEFEVGDKVLVVVVGDEFPVVDILNGGKCCLKGAKGSYLVPPSTRNTSKDSRRTRFDSEL